VAPDIILGKYPNTTYFVGSDPTTLSPPYPRGQQHSVGLGDITYQNLKLLTAAIRLFGDSGAGDKGMPFYTVIFGAAGRRKIFPRQRAPRLPRKLSFLTTSAPHRDCNISPVPPLFSAAPPGTALWRAFPPPMPRAA